jgi:hypothetical protein
MATKILSFIAAMALMVSALVACDLNNIGTSPMYIDNAELMPNSYDFELAREKGLIGAENALTMDYIELQNDYKVAFFEYLDTEIRISGYDKALQQHIYGFVAADREDMTIYQLYGSFGNKFIFLRNNFHIERLSKEDLSILRLPRSRNALRDMAARTYKDIIAVVYEDGSPSFDAIYDTGAMSGVNSAPNDALVLGLRYEWEFDDDGALVSMENERQKEAYTAELAAEIADAITEQLGIPGTVFVYS